MVVKMTVKEDCSRVCARVLSRRAKEREVVVGYISGETRNNSGSHQGGWAVASFQQPPSA